MSYKYQQYRLSHCTPFSPLPIQCTCNCQGSYDDKLCKRIGGKYCETPFRDPLFRKRGVLAPNEVFGTRNCYSGYEGLVDRNDMFRSCHLAIFEPSFFVRYTHAIIALLILTGIAFVSVSLNVCVILKRREQRRQLERRQHAVAPVEQEGHMSQHAFAYAAKKRE